MHLSRFEWIGEIPDGWSECPIRNIVVERDGGAWGTEPENEENSTVCLRIADFDYDNLRFANVAEESLTKREYSWAQIKKLELKKDDILIEKSGGGEKTPVGRAVLFDKKYTALYANFMDRIRVDKSRVSPEFVAYWLNAWYSCKSSPYYINQTTGIQNINITLMLSKEHIFFPSLIKQKEIVKFLDFMCEKINRMKIEIQEQIESLESYKKSLITEIVTKGLDTSAKTKDSGVNWIGKIPADWNIKPFGYVLKERNEKNIPVKTNERLSLSIDKGITLYADKTTNLDRFKDDVSQYKIAHRGDFVMNSMNMIVGAFDVSAYYGCVSPAYYTFYDETYDHVQARFCNYFFKMKPMMKVLFSLGKGIMAIDRGEDRINTCRLKVSRYDLNKLPICVPNLDVQRKIVEFLDDKCGMIDRIISKKAEQIELLDEYRKSIIYEYITGKKEVPSI